MSELLEDEVYKGKKISKAEFSPCDIIFHFDDGSQLRLSGTNEGYIEVDEYDDTSYVYKKCEKCGRNDMCEEIPCMGYSLWMCKWCASAAYHSGEAV